MKDEWEMCGHVLNNAVLFTLNDIESRFKVVLVLTN